MEGKRIQKPNMRPELGSSACPVLFNFTISWLFNFTKYWWYKKIPSPIHFSLIYSPVQNYLLKFVFYSVPALRSTDS